MSETDPWEPGTYQYRLFVEDKGKYQYYLEKDLKRKRDYGQVWEQEWETEKAKRWQDIADSERNYYRPRRLSEVEKRSLVADLTVLLGEHCSSLLEASNAAVALANLYHMEKKT